MTEVGRNDSVKFSPLLRHRLMDQNQNIGKNGKIPISRHYFFTLEGLIFAGIKLGGDLISRQKIAAKSANFNSRENSRKNHQKKPKISPKLREFIKGNTRSINKIREIKSPRKLQIHEAAKSAKTYPRENQSQFFLLRYLSASWESDNPSSESTSKNNKKVNYGDKIISIISSLDSLKNLMKRTTCCPTRSRTIIPDYRLII